MMNFLVFLANLLKKLSSLQRIIINKQLKRYAYRKTSTLVLINIEIR